MQAALVIREKHEHLKKKKSKARGAHYGYDLPAHVATKQIGPFPKYPPASWGGLSGVLLSPAPTQNLARSKSHVQSKAAWQDREHRHEERRDSCADSDVNTHRNKQLEAHRRWVRKNRIHDASLGECSSEDGDLYGPYGVHAAVTNALLYIGLGTTALGMIITFVGTGEKGFKTVELRFIGPSLVVAGFLIILFRILLCVCPSACLRHKHKHKNTTNKLNSEDLGNTLLKDSKKVSISTVQSTNQPPVTISFANEIELATLDVSPPISNPVTSPSDISVTSLDGRPLDSEKTLTSPTVHELPKPIVKRTSKYESIRTPRNARINELLLSPTKLEDVIEDT